MRSEASSSGGGGGGRGESVVVDVGRRKSTCGYCKSGARTSISHGLWAHSLTVDDYQALLDRGWRRSGCYLYKPDMEKTCCPSYTIRLKAIDFVPSKEQVRVSKRVQRFLDGALDEKRMDKLTDERITSGESCSIEHNRDINSSAMESSIASPKDKDKAEQLMDYFSDQINNIVQLCIKNGEFPANIQFPEASIKKIAPTKRKLQAEKSEELIFTCNLAFQIAATIKRLKKDDLPQLSPKTIADILGSHLKLLVESCDFSVRACNGHINFYSSMNHADLAEVESATVSKNPPTASGTNDKLPKKSSRKIEIRLKRSSFDNEEYLLYKKYQLRVHNDTPEHVTESSYRRFLVDTPLVYVPPNDDGFVPPCGFGSFHQQYLIDGKLIAVGVIDILPKCLSSKYLFWDPDLAFLSLGKYSALEEIRSVCENQVHCPSLQYYYLGYYIHSCGKMRYKAAYQPSELLCPLRYEWVRYDVAKPFLDIRKYVVLSDCSTSQNGGSSTLNVVDSHMEEQNTEFAHEVSNDVLVDNDEMVELDSDSSDVESDSEASGATNVDLEDADVNDVLIGVRGNHLRYKDLVHAFDPNQTKFIESQLQRYIRVVGTELSNRMVYFIG